MAQAERIDRPTRWNAAFDPEMSDVDFEMLMERTEIKSIEADAFPKTVSLDGIVRYDMRVNHYNAGDIVVREGDYGNSAFLILKGDLVIARDPGIPADQLGRVQADRQGILQRLANVWRNSWIPEVRDTERYGQRTGGAGIQAGKRGAFLQDVPAIMREQDTIILGEGTLFGELAALGRVPRSTTIFAQDTAIVMEIRWQGLRDIMKFDREWRRKINELYREAALESYLRQIEILDDVDNEHFSEIAKHCLFETYGTFDWNVTFRRGKPDEPVIAREGDYPDGLLVIRAGFARVSQQYGNGKRTLTYLGAGDMYGLEELYQAWKNPESADLSLNCTISALGYVDVIRIPVTVLEEHVFPSMKAPPGTELSLIDRTVAEDALLEWAIDKRYMNGTQSMVVDMDKCVRCDDCVRACSATHGGNPRFRREGQLFDHWMVANSCMHCKDPVCMIGCPTGAIHRSIETGTVLINDDTCIGCATCANSCPYSNIVMVPIRNKQGVPLIDTAESGQPIVKASKCDLCAGRPGGPACVRACPHDALSRVDFRDFHLEAMD
ncbi:MAG: cyclic nucleotide-binding domain-containing protein [Rhodospirillaceae bacterium]|nr:cyclic nucleotide-binding domain-containing protein [Rhodospirillaceae bacterium]